MKYQDNILFKERIRIRKAAKLMYYELVNYITWDVLMKISKHRSNAGQILL